MFKNLAPFLYHVNLFVFRGIKGRKKEKKTEKDESFDKGSGWHTIALERLAVSISQSCTIRSCFRRRDKRVKKETERLETGVNCRASSGLHRQFRAAGENVARVFPKRKNRDINSLGFDAWCWYFLTRNQAKITCPEMVEEIIRKRTEISTRCFVIERMENLWQEK